MIRITLKKKMMMNKITRTAAAIFFMYSGTLMAQQELILDLGYNPVIKSEILKQSSQPASMRSQSGGTDTLFLPFYDDFSKKTVWPSAERWEDSAAFVNFNFPMNPPTIGVATFDGLNSEGNPYDNSNANANGLCDVMTSKPINLSHDFNGLPYDASDSIFLVFYYQRRGRGDNPESSDSLSLQFWNHTAQSWSHAWSAQGNTSGDTDFNKVVISINDTAYRKNGFRFRFRNFGSKTGMLDLWHVDYISLNKFLPPDYEIIRDYAFVYEG